MCILGSIWEYGMYKLFPLGIIPTWLNSLSWTWNPKVWRWTIFTTFLMARHACTNFTWRTVKSLVLQVVSPFNVCNISVSNIVAILRCPTQVNWWPPKYILSDWGGSGSHQSVPGQEYTLLIYNLAVTWTKQREKKEPTWGNKLLDIFMCQLALLFIGS